jgi:hypothetical protein
MLLVGMRMRVVVLMGVVLCVRVCVRMLVIVAAPHHPSRRPRVRANRYTVDGDLPGEVTATLCYSHTLDTRQDTSRPSLADR